MKPRTLVTHTARWRDHCSDALIFAALGFISAFFPAQADPHPAAWLPLGYAIHLLFKRGPRAIPSVIAGSVLAALALSTRSAAEASSITLAFHVAATVSAALLTWWGFTRVYPGQSPFDRYTAYLWLVGTLTMACFVAALGLSVDTSGLNSALLLQNWSIGFLGSITLLPALMTLRKRVFLQDCRQRGGELTIWSACLLFMAVLLWHDPLQTIFLLLPLMIWAATRFGFATALGAIGAAGLTGLATALQGLPAGTNATDHLLIQALIAVMLISAYYVRVLLRDREDIENQLEELVALRTRDLQHANDELRDEVLVRLKTEKSLSLSSRRYQELFEAASSPFVVIDPNFYIHQWNGAAEALFGHSRDEAIGLNFVEAFLPAEQRDELSWKVVKLLNSGLQQDSIETEVRGSDHSCHHILWNLTRMSSDDPEQARLIMVGQDISEIRRNQSQLHYLAHFDVLTNTANRRLFEDRCKQAITSALRHGYYCALICLDVDHFKRINDTLGHDAGDQLLQTIASRLQDCVREEDTVARLGGDEFAVLLTQVSGAEGAEKVARSILHALGQPLELVGGDLVVTSSIGITLAPEDGRTYEQLLKNADMAMYRAKSSGRNTLQFFSEDMNSEMQRQTTLERELREGIALGQLDLYYQPLVSAATGSVRDMEALLRWHHPQNGVLTPADFLDVAEHTGQLQALAEWVCFNACLQARAMQAMSGHSISVRINLSSRQYYNPKLVGQLKRALKETRLDPALLLIEIDEGTLGAPGAEAKNTLAELKALGVKLVLDKFGSGLVSLWHLRELPFDQVKIDQKLLQLAAVDESAATMVHTLINLAQQLALTVSATGIETAAQEEFMRAAGCHLLQGHRFSPAIASTQLADLFDRLAEGYPLVAEHSDAL
ncbi:EAL domain-containing protein [Marinobacter sp. X15-166B]|uniref:bifunctional diguanylate cyclase/phosphodiesterase n=1 Tax=Marinobacter sp. X15-166B TaxID=1897620 RepID=UPI00085BF3D7|nr:EAL domain-containing protein [Marinobacter sp. X15-166B]OEY67792.1 hypothetical protein BG841_16085 [Marinobacter sp. X15-166B]